MLLYFESLTVSFHHRRFRIADANSGGRGKASFPNIYTGNPPMLDHESDTWMPGRFRIKTGLPILIFRHGEFFLERRIQLRKPHSDPDRSHSIQVDNPGPSTRSCGKHTAEQTGHNAQVHGVILLWKRPRIKRKSRIRTKEETRVHSREFAAAVFISSPLSLSPHSHYDHRHAPPPHAHLRSAQRKQRTTCPSSSPAARFLQQ